MTNMTGLSKKARVLTVAVLFLLPFVALEISSMFIYNSKFTEKEKLYLGALMGLSRASSPSEITFYEPHHYMIYTLNAHAMASYQNFYGAKPEYFINSLGYRGKEFPLKKPEGTFRIVCIGSSTTFGLHEADETQTYPQLLEDALNRRYASPRFEVINAGTPGWTAAECLINLQFRLLELSPNMIIVYEGVNETFAMRRDEEGKSDYSNFRQALSYAKPEPWETFLCRYSAFYRLCYVGTHAVSLDVCALTIKPKPQATDEDKNLDYATGKYFVRNMENIVAIAKAHAITPVLMTMGHGPWHQSLALNNQITRDVAAKTGARLVDFEKAARPSYFLSDHVHLQRSGNQALVKTLLNALTPADFNMAK